MHLTPCRAASGFEVPGSQTSRLSLLASHLTPLSPLTLRDIIPSHTASSMTDLNNKTCSDPDETSVKVPLFHQSDSLVINPSIDSKMFSIDASNTANDLSVPAHLQKLFDMGLEAAHLSLLNKQSLVSDLRRNSCAFATDSQDLRLCTALQHDIETGEARPIKQPPRRPPLSAREAEAAILREMLKSGVIEPSNSPWPSPVCMVRKKERLFHFCTDYRKLNLSKISLKSKIFLKHL